MNVPSHASNAARSLIQLHETHLREFLDVWRQARKADVRLPATEDASYASLDTLGRHVLGAARGYMVWMCRVLELPDPGIETMPDAEAMDSEAERYLEHVLERWKTPLVAVPEPRFHRPTYPSRWGVDYCVDAMMEHAVMHPIRHTFQLRRLLDEHPSG